MSKILDVNDMLDAAEDCELPERESLQTALELAANDLACALATHLDITMGQEAQYERGFGGLCASFEPRFPKQACPDAIDAGDPSGEWEESE
jgi:hypothetical protein